MQDKFAQARKAQDEGRSEDAAKLMDECDALQKDFELEKRLYERERAMVPDEPEGDDPGDPGTRKEISGFAIIAKLLRRQPLSDEVIYNEVLLTRQIPGGNANRHIFCAAGNNKKVSKRRNRATGRRATLPPGGSAGFGYVSRVWVRVWVRQLPHILSHT